MAVKGEIAHGFWFGLGLAAAAIVAGILMGQSGYRFA